MQFTEEQFEHDGVIFDSPDTDEVIAKRISSPTFGQKARNISRAYGETYYHEKAVEGVFGQHGFKFQRLLKGVIDRHQDLIVLRKPA